MNKLIFILFCSFLAHGEVVNQLSFTPKAGSYIFLVLEEAVESGHNNQEVIYREFYDQKVHTSWNIKIEKDFNEDRNNFNILWDIKQLKPKPDLPYIIAKLSKTLTMPRTGLSVNNNILISDLEGGEVRLYSMSIVNVDGAPISLKIYSIPTLKLAKKVIKPTVEDPRVFDVKK